MTTPAAAAAPPCPVCGQPVVAALRPFCSRGCRDRDLISWLSDDYRLPGRETGPDGLDSPVDPD